MDTRSIRQVQQQISAMGCPRFEVGAIKQDDENARQLLEVRDAEWFMEPKNLQRLAAYNMKGHHIYVRPFGDHNLSLVDDLTAKKVARMKEDGFEPAVVVETSPGNFQAWVKHSEVFRAGKLQESTLAAKMLAEIYGGDDGAAKGRGFGRLAGFTNQKEKYAFYRDQTGRIVDGPKPGEELTTGLRKFFPFSQLKEYEGRVYTRAEEFAKAVHERFAHRQEAEQQAAIKWNQVQQARPVIQRSSNQQTLADFYARPEYAVGNDKSRNAHGADFAFAIYALDRLRMTPTQVMDAIDRDTRAESAGERGSRKRQEYLQRTVDNAIPRSGRWRTSGHQTGHER